MKRRFLLTRSWLKAGLAVLRKSVSRVEKYLELNHDLMKRLQVLLYVLILSIGHSEVRDKKVLQNLWRSLRVY